MRPAVAVAALLLLAPGQGAAQEMRDFTSARQRHGESRLTTRLDFAAGTLRLQRGDPARLYDLALTYDIERYRPISRFDPVAGAVHLGLASTGGAGIRVSSRGQLEQDAVVRLSPAVALALDVTLGAVDAELELGGLRVTSLRVGTGASRAAIRFSTPNLSRCGVAEVEAGAAEVALAGLGNSRCDRVTFKGGVGRALLDLSGSWSGDAELDVAMTMGELTLRLPRSLGVRVDVERFLAGFAGAGWTREGNTYLSPGYAAAERKVRIALSTAIGTVNVEWLP
ncbi:MAG TPA: hypothetical protein VF037_00590 [Gemmatimonadales bacterium]